MPDQRRYLFPSEQQILLRQYAPVLVLFPELPEQAPYPDEGDAVYTMRGSYHPRAVEFFLQEASIHYRQRFLLRHPNLWFKDRNYKDEIREVEKTIASREFEQAVAAIAQNPRYRALSEAARRRVAWKSLMQKRLAARIRGFDLPLERSQNIKFWQHYHDRLATSPPAARRSVIYGRVVQGRAPLDSELLSAETLLDQGPTYGPFDVRCNRVALQYWFHYYYDDWANRHEGDWEGLTILVELDPHIFDQERELTAGELLAGIKVHDVGYASHEEGYRRRWEDVQKTADGRPIVYVARGSSASYFAWRLDGYPASARLSVLEKFAEWPGKLLRGRRLFGRRWDAAFSARVIGRDPKNVDWVAADPLPHDRLGTQVQNPLERMVPRPCQGVRRAPSFEPDAGFDEETYHLEADNLLWLEMVQEYGIQWGENSRFPGSKGPKGRAPARRAKERRTIYQLAVLETTIQRTLHDLSRVRWDSEQAIPELAAALKRLRPRNLRRKQCFPRGVRAYVHAMWAWILEDHPEAWPSGPGLWLSLVFRSMLYPGVLRFLRKKPTPEAILARKDPMYHIKTLLAQVRRARYEAQHPGAKWDNPFAWVRYVCQADTFFYGKSSNPVAAHENLLWRLDCVDKEMSLE